VNPVGRKVHNGKECRDKNPFFLEERAIRWVMTFIQAKLKEISP